MSKIRLGFRRPNEPPMPDPLAYFLTWTTYGSWLPGDERGWVKRGKGYQLADPVVHSAAIRLMKEPACFLEERQQELVEATIRDHCDIRKWQLHAVNARSNHVHVVVTSTREPDDVRDQFKAWCTRKLKEQQRATITARRASEGTDSSNPAIVIRENWWTEKGSQRYILDEESLEAVIIYVLEAQDRMGRDSAEV